MCMQSQGPAGAAGTPKHYRFYSSQVADIGPAQSQSIPINITHETVRGQLAHVGLDTKIPLDLIILPIISRAPPPPCLLPGR